MTTASTRVDDPFLITADPAALDILIADLHNTVAQGSQPLARQLGQAAEAFEAAATGEGATSLRSLFDRVGGAVALGAGVNTAAADALTALRRVLTECLRQQRELVARYAEGASLTAGVLTAHVGAAQCARALNDLQLLKSTWRAASTRTASYLHDLRGKLPHPGGDALPYWWHEGVDGFWGALSYGVAGVASAVLRFNSVRMLLDAEGFERDLDGVLTSLGHMVTHPGDTLEAVRNAAVASPSATIGGLLTLPLAATTRVTALETIEETEVLATTAALTADNTTVTVTSALDGGSSLAEGAAIRRDRLGKALRTLAIMNDPGFPETLDVVKSILGERGRHLISDGRSIWKDVRFAEDFLREAMDEWHQGSGSLEHLEVYLDGLRSEVNHQAGFYAQVEAELRDHLAGLNSGQLLDSTASAEQVAQQIATLQSMRESLDNPLVHEATAMLKQVDPALPSAVPNAGSEIADAGSDRFRPVRASANLVFPTNAGWDVELTRWEEAVATCERELAEHVHEWERTGQDVARVQLESKLQEYTRYEQSLAFYYGGAAERMAKVVAQLESGVQLQTGIPTEALVAHVEELRMLKDYRSGIAAHAQAALADLPSLPSPSAGQALPAPPPRLPD